MMAKIFSVAATSEAPRKPPFPSCSHILNNVRNARPRDVLQKQRFCLFKVALGTAPHPGIHSHFCEAVEPLTPQNQVSTAVPDLRVYFYLLVSESQLQPTQI